MSEKFDDALDFVLEHEGGLVDDPQDPGGLTNMGISLRFGEEIGLSAEDIRAMTRERAGEIYREHFWDVCRCDELPGAIAFYLFDAAVNQGTGAATRMLQRAAGVGADGIIGPVTLGAVESFPGDLLAEIDARRALRYARTANFDRFGRGWMRRRAHAFSRAKEVDE